MIDEKKLIEIASSLIAIKSNTGEEEKIVKEIASWMEKLGYDEIFVDEAGNIVGGIHGETEGQTILFDGHIDTVEAENHTEWQNGNPYEPYISEDKLFGRGTSDMKGAFAAMLYALSQIDRSKLKGQVYLSGTVNEEVAEGYTIELVTDKIKPDLVVIGEATNLNINIGQRGRGEIYLKVFGKSAHSSNPAVGINSILKMNKALAKIEAEYQADEDVLGKGILVLTDIISTPYPGESVIPRLCTATFDKRIILQETKEGILNKIREILDHIKSEDKDFSYELGYRENQIKTYTGYSIKGDKFYPPWRISEEDAVVNKAIDLLKDINLDPEINSYSFCTNGSSTCGVKGIKTIGFGPGREEEAHITNEFITLEGLRKSAEGYLDLSYILS